MLAAESGDPAIRSGRRRRRHRGLEGRSCRAWHPVVGRPDAEQGECYPDGSRAGSPSDRACSPTTRDLLARLEAADVEVWIFARFADARTKAQADRAPLYLVQDSHGLLCTAAKAVGSG
jgi:hypothetical protein